jgi:hypothetical protein
MTFLEDRLALCGAAVGPGRAVSYCRIQVCFALTGFE